MATSLRTIGSPRGTSLTCKGWPQEAAMRMLMNNLDPEVAQRPEDLVVYGGSGKAARNWECGDASVRTLQSLEHDETLLVPSGKPVGVFHTHPGAPRVLIANALLVPAWAAWENFRDLEQPGLTIYGQMTAGSWSDIGSQGIVQGTYDTLAEVARRHFGGTLSGRLVVTAGLGGMGGTQPLAATMNGAAALVVEVDRQRIARRLATRYLDEATDSLDEALDRVGLGINDLVREGTLKAPIVIERDPLDTGAVAPPHRETEGMRDGSDAIADWPILNALLTTSSGATWVSIHHGGGGIGDSLHAGMVIVADGTTDADERLERVLTCGPDIGVARHADAGYPAALITAEREGVRILMREDHREC